MYSFNYNIVGDVIEINSGKRRIYCVVKRCFIEDLDSCVKRATSYMDKYSDLVIAFIPTTIPVSHRLIIQSIVYTYMSLERKTRVRNKGLMLLSILFTRRQLSEVANLVREYSMKNKQVYVIVTALSLEAINKVDWTELARDCCLVREASLEEYLSEPTSIEALSRIYGLDENSLSNPMDIEKYLLTKISRHYLSML